MVCSKKGANKNGTRRKRRCTYKPYGGIQYKGINNFNKCPENRARRAERQKGYRAFKRAANAQLGLML